MRPISAAAVICFGTFSASVFGGLGPAHAAGKVSPFYYGPVNKTQTCTKNPQTVTLSEDTRLVFCTEAYKSWEARRDIETSDNGSAWTYKKSSTIYLDCQTPDECKAIEPITRQRVCHVSTC